MSRTLAQRTGSAVLWQVLQLGGAQLIHVLRLLILARLLVPEDFGLLTIAAIAVQFLLRLTDVGITPALIQRESADSRFYESAWTMGLVRALLVSTAVFVSAPWIADAFAEPRATPIMRVLALRPLIYSLASIKVVDFTRDLNLRSVAVLRLGEAFIAALVAILLAPAWGVWALVAGTISGAASHAAVSYALAPWRPALSLDRAATSGLFRFGRWIFATGLLAVAAQAVLNATISRRLGTTELGLYYLAARLAFLPAETLSQVIDGVAFPLYSRLQSDARQVTTAFRTFLTAMGALLIPVTAAIVVLAPSLVDNVLGAEWQGAAPIIGILAIISLIGALGDAAIPLFKGLGHPQKATLMEFTRSFILILLVWDLAARFGLLGVAAAWIPATGASALLTLMLLRGLLPQPFAGLGRPLGAVTLAALLGSLLAYATDSALPGLAGLLAGGMTWAATVGAILWLTDRRSDLGLSSSMIRAFPSLAGLLGRVGDGNEEQA